MMLPVPSHRISILLPLGTCIIGICTLIICVIINRSLDHYIGNIPYPFFSYCGRDPPERFVFATGLTITGLMSFLTNGWVVYNHLKTREIDSVHFRNVRRVSVVACIPMALGLALLACLNTKDFPDLHLYAAILFFVCSIIIIACFTIAWYIMARAEPTNRLLWNSFYMKAALDVVVLVGFILYLPLGLAVSCSEDLENGEVDYSPCFRTNLMRTISQHVTVISLLLFLGILTIDMRRAAKCSRVWPAPSDLKVEASNEA